VPDYDKGEPDYIIFQKEQELRWESLCARCGACCGALDGDPCEHLAEEAPGRFFCRIYENRFGLRTTRSGRLFRCLPIRYILHDAWPGRERCVYGQRYKKLFMEGS